MLTATFFTSKRGVASATLALGLASAASNVHAEGQLNVICSVQAEWCSMIATVYTRTTGTKINIVQKGSGEAIAQINAESANPKTDVWFGGTGDPHLQAAEQGLTLEYKSPSLNTLHPWAVQQAEQSGFKTVGIYAGPLGVAYNTELLAKKKLAAPVCWKDLLKPEFKGEIQMANPNSSGTAYVAIATMVQLMGEEKAFQYLKDLHKNIGQYPRSGTGPIKNVARGEATLSISFIHDAPGEKEKGFPVGAVAPCEGTGFEIGSISIVKGARNLENAKKFYDWSLTAAAQEMGAAAKQYQVPSNKSAKVDPRVPDFRKIKFINYDFGKYGKTAERKRLIERWEKDVNSIPR